jgi:hypothetical protein
LPRTSSGILFGYAQLTNTRSLALVGDPEANAYELLFSFSSSEEKDQFLELANPVREGLPKITGQSSESNLRSGGEKCIVLQWDLLWRKEDLRVPGQDLESTTLGRTPRCYLVFLWLLSALTCICAQSSRDVHRAPASDGHPWRTTESVFTSEALRGVMTMSQFTPS